MNIFNIKGFPSDAGGDEDFSVGGVRSPQSALPSIDRPRKPVSHEKPFEKYMEEPKKGKEKDEVSQETTAESPLESPLLARMGKAPIEREDLGGKSASTPFPSSFPAKEAKSSSVHSNSFPESFHESKKSVSSHKRDHEPGVASFSEIKGPGPKVKKKGSLGGEEISGDEDSLFDETAPIEAHKKTPDQVVWGAAMLSNKPLGDAMGGDVSQQPKSMTAEAISQPKLKPEVALPKVALKEFVVDEDDSKGMALESPKISKKVEETPVPVIGAEVNTMNIVAPHTQPRLSVAGVEAAEVKPPVASTSAVLKSLVEQIVSRVDTLTKGERMESVITLKQSPTLPPGFENATIRLTSVASARGEVNITFGGLTQSAAQLVQNNQADLLNALSTRGITVHIFSASTQQDPIAAQASSAGSDQQQQQAFGQSPQQQQRRQRDQEEGEYT